MAFIGMVQIDPKDYPFKKFIDECKHLDCDEHRDLIKPIHHNITDFKGQEHLFCDKEQLCPKGKFKRCQKTKEAEEKCFCNPMEMHKANKKAEDDKKLQEAEDMKKKLEKSQQDFDDYKKTMEARFEAERDTTIRRFDKLATMLQALGGSK